MDKLKKYQVVVESRCLTTVVVEAESATDAGEMVNEGEYDDPRDVTHEDSEVISIREIAEELLDEIDYREPDE